MTWERIGLPGVGVSHVFTTREGTRLGIVSRLDGSRDLNVYDRAEPERAAGTVLLHPDEAQLVADVLHATVTVDHVAGLSHLPGGVQTVQVRLPAGSTYAGRRLHDLQAQTAVSIVALLRGTEVLASPDPDLVLDPGDVLLCVGDAAGVAQLDELLVC